MSPDETQKQTPTYVDKVRSLEKEILENPEFDNAFPHLKKYKSSTRAPLQKKELDFIKSLFYQYRNQEIITTSDVITYNLKRFSEGYTRPEGPFKEMSPEDIEKVHLIVDLKLQELEEMNLSREEIFELKNSKKTDFSPENLKFKEKKGLKLADDPFFQFFKNERLARELLISPNEAFTVEKILNLALRQDVGPDMAASLPNKNIHKSEELTDTQRLEFGGNRCLYLLIFFYEYFMSLFIEVIQNLWVFINFFIEVIENFFNLLRNFFWLF